MSLCLTCSQTKPLKDKTTSVASWLKNAGRDNALPHYNLPSTTRKPFCPSNATVSVRMRIGQPSKHPRKILYWAAKPKKISDKILSAIKSYGRYANMGITYVGTDGFATFKIRSPRPYKEHGIVWPPHLHYAFCKKNKKEWSTTVWAVAAYPGHHGAKLRTGTHKKEYEYEMKCLDDKRNQCSILTPKQVYRYWKDLIVVCALPKQYKIASPKHASKGNHFIVDFHKATNADVKEACKRIGNKPYVIYCANPTCMAASKMISRLVQCGARNVYYMPAGSEGWNQMLSQKK